LPRNNLINPDNEFYVANKSGWHEE
jgi:hypothetical protein